MLPKVAKVDKVVNFSMWSRRPKVASVAKVPEDAEFTKEADVAEL